MAIAHVTKPNNVKLKNMNTNYGEYIYIYMR